MSFSEIRRKDVVNICDGKKLGKPIDLVLNDSACAEALVVPGRSGGLLGLLRQDREGCVIPWGRVRRVGDDVILVEIDSRTDGPE
ncbi:MAG: YlmC/YmxH family sporulation protein [Clostridia bacterium]|nr:YlmC/YmxH family sporulation protein [Clostridia bacterium]